MKPILKYVIQRNDIDDSICLRASGTTHEIKDPDKKWSRFLSLLDGKNTVEDIADLSKMDIKEVLDACDKLDKLFLLENADMETGALNEYEKSRWERNLNFLGSYCYLEGNKYLLQKRIIDSSVLLLGIGGLGSHILFDLAAMGVGHIVGMDFDVVDISNLNRQIIYRENDIGHNKLECAKKNINEFCSSMKFSIINKKIESSHDIDIVLKKHQFDAVILVADRPKMFLSEWVNKACCENNVPLITGGLDTKFARIMSFLPKKTGCIQCWRDNVKEKDPYSDRLITEQRVNQLRGDNAAFIPLVTIVGGIMIAEFSKLITNFSSMETLGRCLEFDLVDFKLRERETWKKNPNCPICSNEIYT